MKCSKLKLFGIICIYKYNYMITFTELLPGKVEQNIV